MRRDEVGAGAPVPREIGRRIVEYEQGGEARAEYGAALIKRVSQDLSIRFGRGFSKRNVEQMRLFYLTWPIAQISSAQFERFQTMSEKSDDRIIQTLSGQLPLSDIVASFPLPWSQYVRLMSVKNPDARAFYEAESLRGGWTSGGRKSKLYENVVQLAQVRQIPPASPPPFSKVG